jgi:DNA repair exonuclease SbcCD ATPase subunit
VSTGLKYNKVTVCTLDDYKALGLQQYVWDDTHYCYPAEVALPPLFEHVQEQQQQQRLPAVVAAVQHSAAANASRGNSDLRGAATTVPAAATDTAASGATSKAAVKVLQSQLAAEQQRSEAFKQRALRAEAAQRENAHARATAEAEQRKEAKARQTAEQRVDALQLNNTVLANENAELRSNLTSVEQRADVLQLNLTAAGSLVQKLRSNLTSVAQRAGNLTSVVEAKDKKITALEDKLKSYWVALTMWQLCYCALAGAAILAASCKAVDKWHIRKKVAEAGTADYNRCRLAMQQQVAVANFLQEAAELQAQHAELMLELQT